MNENSLPSNGLLVVPPMAGVEDQQIGIFPPKWIPIHSIQLKGCLDVLRRPGRRPALYDEERRSVVLNGTIVILELEYQETFMLCNRISIHFIYWIFISNCRSKHAEEWFPLVSSDRIAHENQSLVPQHL